MLNSLSQLHIPWYKIDVVDAVAYTTCTARQPARRRTRRRVCCANVPTHRLALTSLQVKSNKLLRSRPVPAALKCPLGTAVNVSGQPDQHGHCDNVSRGPLSLAAREGWWSVLSSAATSRNSVLLLLAVSSNFCANVLRQLSCPSRCPSCAPARQSQRSRRLLTRPCQARKCSFSQAHADCLLSPSSTSSNNRCLDPEHHCLGITSLHLVARREIPKFVPRSRETPAPAKNTGTGMW